MRKKWEKANERKWKERGYWKEIEKRTKGKWEEHERKMKVPAEADVEELGSGFWCPLTSFDTSFGRSSDVVRNLDEHPCGIQYFTSCSRSCLGLVPPQSSEEKVKTACLVIRYDQVHVISALMLWIIGVPVPVWFDCFSWGLMPLWRCFGSCVHNVFRQLSDNKTYQNRVCRTSASHVFGELIWLSDPIASQWDLTYFHTMGRL